MTSTLSEQELYQLAGEAVASSQMFEAIFVIAAKLAIQQQGANTLEDIVPLSISKSFKQPIKAILQELSKVQSIESNLENRISSLVEDRHRVVHRAFFEFGWPSSSFQESEKSTEFSELCNRVTVESKQLTMLFYKFVLSWMQQFPETVEIVRKHEALSGVTTKQIQEAVDIVNGD